MINFRKTCLTFVFIAILGFITGSRAGAEQLLTNGNFETGTFAGWTVTDRTDGVGTWVIDTPGTTTQFGLPTAANAGGGSSYAVTDLGGPGTHALEQSFNVSGTASSVILTFEMFINDFSGQGPIIDPIGLDHTGPDNQHARVDILSAGSAPFETGAGVLMNFFLGVDISAIPNPYTSYTFDITSLVGGGGTFDLRFAGVDNAGLFTLGVDNVSIMAELEQGQEPTPEPATIILLGIGLVGLAGATSRRKWKKKAIDNS